MNREKTDLAVIQLKEEDILLKLTSFEDSFVERKSSGDSQDWLKTAVAFANSAPIGYPAILFVGVKDEGTAEGTANLDSLQKSLSRKLADAYPPIYCVTKVLQQNGTQFLAVIIPGSVHRPHFAGQAYVRDGSQTLVASTEQFNKLIDDRNSKVRYLLEYKGKMILYRRLQPAVTSVKEGVLTDCNQFFLTVNDRTSIPLERVLISSEPERGMLKLDFDYP